MKILETESLSISYDGKKYALHNCSFSLKKGKICAVVGESGSGKSTLLRLIAGLERPNNGTIKINGETVSSDTLIIPPQQRNVGLVFQNFALFPHLTVQQNIAFGLKKDKKHIVMDLLSLIKMEDYANAYPAELSGGQEQRVALVRTMALNPSLLLLDEPFSNLDTMLKSALRKEVRSMVKAMKTSMIFITHDLFDAIDIADNIMLLKDGELVQHSSVADFAASIQSENAKEMLEDLKNNAKQILNIFPKSK